MHDTKVYSNILIWSKKAEGGKKCSLASSTNLLGVSLSISWVSPRKLKILLWTLNLLFQKYFSNLNFRPFRIQLKLSGLYTSSRTMWLTTHVVSGQLFVVVITHLFVHFKILTKLRNWNVNNKRNFTTIKKWYIPELCEMLMNLMEPLPKEN